MRVSLLALPIALLLIGCGDDHGTNAPAGVVYENGGTDEAWVAIDEATLVTNDASAPRLIAPTVLDRSAAQPPAFEWTPGALATLQRALPRGRVHTRASWLAALWSPTVARAHEPPVTGDQYRLELSVGEGDPIRVLTGANTWTPNENAWARIVAAAGPVTVRIIGAYLMSGRVTEGPFVASEPTSIPFAE